MQAMSETKIVFCKQEIPWTCFKVQFSSVASAVPSWPMPIKVSTVAVIGIKGLNLVIFVVGKNNVAPITIQPSGFPEY